MAGCPGQGGGLGSVLSNQILVDISVVASSLGRNGPLLSLTALKGEVFFHSFTLHYSDLSLLPSSRLTFIFLPLFSRRESADLWKVVLGINNLDHPSPYLQTRGVESIIVHPRYNRAVVDYDISVVELDREVEVTSYVRPVCLPGNGQLPQPDTYCYITGWGHMGNRSEFDTYGSPYILYIHTQ